MEKLIGIPTFDGHIAYGTLNRVSKSDSLIIFIHGISGNKDQPHFFNAVDYFNNKGFDTFRLDLYSDEDKGRVLGDCSIKVHVKDLETVIDFFAPKYQNIYLVGHSLGGTTIVNSNTAKVKRIVLWDPSQGMHSFEEKACTYNESLDKYILDWRLTLIVSKDMIDDWMDAADIDKQLSKIKLPCKFIFAQSCEIYDGWKDHLRDLPFDNEVFLIPNATHDFVEKGAINTLLEETYNWIIKD